MIRHILLALLAAALSNTGTCSEVDVHTDKPRPIRIGVLDNNPPWIYRQDNQLTGIVIERYKTMFHELNIPIQITGYDNLLRPIKELLSGNIDLATMLFSEELTPPPLENVICTTEPFTTGNSSFYRTRDSNHIKVDDFPDLNQYKIGITRFISLEYVSYVDKKNISQLKTPEFLVKMLKAKRIDIALLEKGTAIYWSDKYQVPLQELLHAGNFDVNICLSESSMGKEASRSLKRRIDDYLIQNPIPDYNLHDNENFLRQK